MDGPSSCTSNIPNIFVFQITLLYIIWIFSSVFLSDVCKYQLIETGKAPIREFFINNNVYALTSTLRRVRYYCVFQTLYNNYYSRSNLTIQFMNYSWLTLFDDNRYTVAHNIFIRNYVRYHRSWRKHKIPIYFVMKRTSISTIIL